MNKSLNIQKSIVILGLLLLVYAAMILLVNSLYFTKNPNLLSLGITIDLIVIAPLLYVFLIRKTSIPKTTVIPLIMLGILCCSLILPADNQYYLNLFKTWGVPVLELSVLTLLIYKFRKTRKVFLKEKSNTFDFFIVLKNTCSEILPKPLVMPMATEIAVFYYGFINWKVKDLKKNEFTYHKESGTMALLFALILIISAETVGLHYLLLKWNAVFAWIFTGLSIYSGIQIFGFLKSMTKRPILIENNLLYLKYGIMTEAIINLSDIDSIEITSRDIEVNDNLRKLSFLGDLESHNVIMHLKKENTLFGLYGMKKTYKSIAFFADKKEEFKSYLENELALQKTVQNNSNI